MMPIYMSTPKGAKRLRLGQHGGQAAVQTADQLRILVNELADHHRSTHCHILQTGPGALIWLADQYELTGSFLTFPAIYVNLTLMIIDGPVYISMLTFLVFLFPIIDSYPHLSDNREERSWEWRSGIPTPSMFYGQPLQRCCMELSAASPWPWDIISLRQFE